MFHFLKTSKYYLRFQIAKFFLNLKISTTLKQFFYSTIRSHRQSPKFSKSKLFSKSMFLLTYFIRILFISRNTYQVVKSWGGTHPNIANRWESSIRNIYQITCDNKLCQFSFTLLHRILVTNKELTRSGIANDLNCVTCHEPDSLEHTFLECHDFLKLLEASLLWFNVQHLSDIKLSLEEVLLNLLPSSLLLSSVFGKKLSLMTRRKRVPL